MCRGACAYGARISTQALSACGEGHTGQEGVCGSRKKGWGALAHRALYILSSVSSTEHSVGIRQSIRKGLRGKRLKTEAARASPGPWATGQARVVAIGWLSDSSNFALEVIYKC